MRNIRRAEIADLSLTQDSNATSPEFGSMNISFNPIGVIRSVFKDPASAGRQPIVDGQAGRIVLNEELALGLDGLDNFSHLIAIYYFHLQDEIRLKAKPCFDSETEHGIFASRYPTRPNHIGISVWTLQNIDNNVLYCSDIDVVDGTPLLDIKPYVKHFDNKNDSRSGWYDLIDWSQINSNTPN